MANRAEEIRKRHEERKRKRNYAASHRQRPAARDFEEPGFSRWRDENDRPSGGNSPLVRKEGIVFRVLLAAILFLAVGVLFKQPPDTFVTAKHYVKRTFSNEFQFAAVSEWYENRFGHPLALFPNPETNEMKANGDQQSLPYAKPVNGKIKASFSETGTGILMETDDKAQVRAVEEGFVTFVGDKEGIGKTVIVQLTNGEQAWYGKLANVHVKLYDYVERGEKIGEVKPAAQGEGGTFYFAIKKEDGFIDPLKVISFE
ncbi:MAG TPA: M23 family metallopeptidase [Bacillales bacterium]|nr:M23 family metallopeptidase [Bacillales bacterium]